MQKYSAEIQDIFKGFEVIDTVPTPEQLKASFNSRLKKDIPIEPEPEEQVVPFWDMFKEFVIECGTQNNWTDATYEKFAATKRHLEDFDANLTLEALNESKLTE